MHLKNLEKSSPEFQRHSVRADLELLGLVSDQIFAEGLAQGIIWRGVRDSQIDVRIALVRRPNAWEVLASAPLLLSLLDGTATQYLQTLHGAPIASDSSHFLVTGSLSPLIKILTNIERLYPVRFRVSEEQASSFVKALLGGVTPSREEQAPLVLNEVRLTGWVEALFPSPEGYRLQVRLTQTPATVTVTFQSLEPDNIPVVTVGCFVYLAGELAESGVRAYDLQVISRKS